MLLCQHWKFRILLFLIGLTVSTLTLVNLKVMQNHQRKKSHRKCSPVQSLAFAKTHKTGSTTLQNIILRYGYGNDLTIALPRRRGWMFDLRFTFRAEYLMQRYANNPSNLFNIFASHCRWSINEVKRVVGRDASFVTILRDPAEVFESGFVYFGIESHLQKDINAFMEELSHKSPRRNRQAIFGKNQLLFDLGMSAHDMENPEKVHLKIQQIERDFQLVLIAEKMEESLILFKDLMCWNLDDIRHLRLNERYEEAKSAMTPLTRERLKRWLWADYELYNYFDQKLQHLIKNYDTERMKLQVHLLQQANQQLSNHCHLMQHADNEDLKGTAYYMASDTVKAMSVSPNCSLFGVSEPSFFQLIRQKQRFIFS